MKRQPPRISTEFINLQSDYGFKRAFGTKQFQNNVVQLLYDTLGDEINIKRIVLKEDENNQGEIQGLSYHDKEVLPAEEDGKKIVYDVYFTIKFRKGESLFKPHHLHKDELGEDVEHHFILEMQNIYIPPFEDRMAYYVSKMVSGQGKAGWNYDLNPVVLLCLTDFDFPHLTPQAVQEFEWREKNTGESLTKKMRMLFYSLKQVPEKWEECHTDLQRRLYIIKNMDKMDKNSEAYKDGAYKDMFDAAESVNISAEGIVAYSQSLAHLREYQTGLDYKYMEGREEGRNLEKIETARKMRQAGLDIDFISQITEIPQNTIKEL